MTRVVGAFIFHNNKLLLIHHKKTDMWLPVAGHVKPKESNKNAIRREIKEEVNLDIPDLVPFISNDDMEEFVAVVKDISTIQPDTKEISNYKWFI